MHTWNSQNSDVGLGTLQLDNALYITLLKICKFICHMNMREKTACAFFIYFLVCLECALFLCSFDKEKVIPKESYARLMLLLSARRYGDCIINFF